MYYYTDLVGMGMLCISGKIKIQHYNAVCMLPACCLHAAVSMSHSHSVYSTTMLSAHCLHVACMLQYLCPTLTQYTALQCCLHAACTLQYLCPTLSIQRLYAMQIEQLYHSLNCVTLTALPEFVSGQI